MALSSGFWYPRVLGSVFFSTSFAVLYKKCLVVTAILRAGTSRNDICFVLVEGDLFSNP